MSNFRLVQLATLMVLFAVSSRTQSPPSQLTKKQANKFLQAAITSQDLQSPGRPFHLLANVTYKLGGTTQNGVFEILWAAPDRFRETFRMDKMSEVNLALRDKMYVLRNTPTLSPQFLHLRNFVHHPLGLYLGSKTTAQKIYSASVGQQLLNCIAVDADKEASVCLDLTTNEVSSIKLDNGYPAAPYNLEENDFLNLGPRRYPRRMTRTIPGQTMTVEITKFVDVTAFQPEVFVPPANSEVRNWSLHPTPKPDYFFATLPFPESSPPRVFYPYYLLTGTNGHIKKFVSLNPSAPPIAPAVAQWIHNAQFPIWVCGQRPLEHEEIVMN